MSKLKFLFIALTVFIGIFAFAQFMSPRFFSLDDNTYFASSYKYSYSSLFLNGQVPLFNFHQYMGLPFLAQGQTGVFFIPSYIAVFLSYMFFKTDLYSCDILAFIFLALACISMYFLVIKLSCKNYIAMAASILWVTMPFIFTVSRSWIFIAYMAFWIPFNFLILLKLSEKQDIKLWLLFTLLRAAMLLNGYVHYFHILFVFEVLFLALSITVKKWFKPRFLLYFFGSYAITALLASVMLLPMYKLASISADRAQPLNFEQITQFALTLDSFIKAQMFEFSSWVFKAPGPQFYIGIPLLLIPLFLVDKNIRGNIDRKILVIFSVCLVAAFILSTKFYGSLSFIPTFSMFRWPCKYYIFFVFFLLIIIALIWDSAIKSEIRVSHLLIPSAIIISILINTGLIVYSGDLLKYGLKYKAPIPFYQNISDTGRFFTGWVKNTPRYAADKLLTGSFALQSGLYHFAGYDPLVSKINLDNSLGLKYMSVYQQQPDKDLFKLLSEKGVKYIVTENSEENMTNLSGYPFLRPIFKDDEIVVFKNGNAMPIIYFSDAPLDPVDFDYKVNDIIISPLKSGELNVSIAPIDGYKVYFDGKFAEAAEQPHLIEYGKYKTYAPIKLQIPENTEKIAIKYEDNYFIIGGIISCITFITIMLISAFLIIKSKRNSTSLVQNKL